MSRKGFKDLIVWQRAKNVAVFIYRFSMQNKALAQDFGLRDQLRRNVVRITSNYASFSALPHRPLPYANFRLILLCI